MEKLTKEQVAQMFTTEWAKPENLAKAYSSLSAVQKNRARQAWYDPKATPVQQQPTQQPAQQPKPTQQQTNPNVQQWTAVYDNQWNLVRPDLLKQSAYEDDSLARQQEIISNLNQARQTNVASLSDLNTFRNYYNYAGRTEQQQQTMDNRYFWYDQWRTLSQQTARSLSEQYNAWVITQSQLDNLKAYDQNKYNATMQFIDQWAILWEYSNALNPKVSENPFQWIIDNMISGLEQTAQVPQFYDEYKNAINSEEMKEQMKAINDLNTQIEELDLDMINAQKLIEKKYEWTDISRPALNAIINDQLTELQNRRSNLAVQMNSKVNQYNSQMQTIQQDMQLRMQDFQMKQQLEQAQMQKIWFAMELMNYRTPEQQMDMQFDAFVRQQEYIDWNIYSNDPATRRKAVANAVDRVLSEFSGIPMLRSREQMIEDIQNLVDNGMSLWEAITKNIREPIQNKDEYKSRLRQQFPTEQYEVWGIMYERNSNGDLVPVSLSWWWDPFNVTRDFISGREWFRENAYQDVWWVWTIWYGFTSINWRPVKEWDHITKAQADIEFDKKLSQYQNRRSFVNIELSAEQQAALTSFEYNLWKWIRQKNAMWILDAINNRDFAKAGEMMKQYNKAWGKVVQWLVNRRNAEASMLMKVATQWGAGSAWYNTNNDYNFQRFQEGDKDIKVFWQTGAEQEKSLKEMWYSSFAEFNVDFMKRQQAQFEEPSEAFVSALNYIIENPLFNYTDVNWVEHKWLLKNARMFDTKMIAQIESNLTRWEKRDKWVVLWAILNPLDYSKIAQYVWALQTVRNSQVIDILKTGKVKLYPMSDADIWLLSSSLWLSLNNFLWWTSTTWLMWALTKMRQAYSGNISQSTTTKKPIDNFFHTPINQTIWVWFNSNNY